MFFDISDSKIKKILEDSRWMFLSTRLHAVVFLVLFFSFCIALSVFYFLEPVKKNLGQYVYPKRNPIEILTQANKFKNNSINVLLLGGSSSREFTGKNTSISKRVSIACGKPVNFLNAGTSSQSYVAARTLYTEYQLRGVDLVIVGMNYFRLIVNPVKLSEDIINNGLLIPTPTDLLLDEIGTVQNIPAIEPLYIAAKLNYFIDESKKKKQKKNIEVDELSEFIARHNLYRKPAKSEKDKKEIVRRFLLTRYPDYIEYGSIGIERWLRFTRYVKNNGSKVLFLVLPQDKSMEVINSYFSPKLETFMFQAREEGASIEDWRNKKLQLVASDYFDQQHLLASGRKKTIQPFVNLIINNLSECQL